MNDPQAGLNDKQRAAARWLSQRVHENMDQNTFCNATGLSTAEYVHLRSTLKMRGCFGNLAKNGMYSDTFTIDRPILEFVRSLPAVQGARPKGVRPKKLDQRDKWIYGRCIAGVAYDAIVAELKRIAAPRGWRVVSTKQRAQQIGVEYAQRNDLPPPSARQNL